MNHLLNLLNIKSAQRRDDLIILMLLLLFSIWLGCWISFQKTEDIPSNSPSNNVENHKRINSNDKAMTVSLADAHPNFLEYEPHLSK